VTNLVYAPRTLLSRLFLKICLFVLSIYIVGRLVTLTGEINVQSPVTWYASTVIMHRVPKKTKPPNFGSKLVKS